MHISRRREKLRSRKKRYIIKTPKVRRKISQPQPNASKFIENLKKLIRNSPIGRDRKCSNSVRLKALLEHQKPTFLKDVLYK